MKAQFLKIAGVKSERDFYKKFPTEESFSKAFPEALKTAQMGTNIPGIVDGMGMGMPGIESTGNMFEELVPINSPFSTQSIVNNMANKLPIPSTSSVDNSPSGLEKVGSQLPGVAGSIIKGIGQIKAQKQKLKKAEQMNQLSGIYRTLSGIREQQPERRYVRPEDSLINPDQLYPSTGVGTNILAKNGKSIDSYQFGGELSNLFSQGGLENIANSGIVDKGMSALFPDMADSGGATIGGAIGEAAGNFIPIPVVGPMIGKTVGKIAGTLLDTTGKKIKKYNKDTENNLTTMMVNNGATGMHQANYSYMEDGGLIPLMEEGGELQTHWGGYAETVSQNPYLEDGGETIMFRGNSHDESDNNGNTGIGITYGNSPVEVERGEPATKIDDELVVYGNLKIPNQYVELFGDDKAKGKKFKNYIKEISKDEEKQNKLLEKSITQLDELNPSDPFDKLKFNSLKSNVLGANTKLKDIAEKKKIAANLQEAINTTAEEYGVEADALAKGKLKYTNQLIPIAQNGNNIVSDQKQFLQSYVDSPMYLYRLKKQFGDEAIKEQQNRSNTLKNVKINYPNFPLGTNYGSIAGMYITKKQREDTINENKYSDTYGQYFKDINFKNPKNFKKGDIYLEKEYKYNIPLNGFETIPIHEMGHALDDNGRNMKTEMIAAIYNRLQTDNDDDLLDTGFDSVLKNKKPIKFKYETVPTEVSARLQSIRYLLNKTNIYDARKRQFNIKDYEKMINDPYIMGETATQDIINNLKGKNEKEKKENFIWLMNNLAKNNKTEDLIPIAKNGITKKKTSSKLDNTHQSLNELTQILSNKGIDFNITSGYRKGEKTAQGRTSRHATGEALDITFPKLGKEAYNKMINDPDIAKFVYDNGLTVIDEYDPNNLSQTKGSGGHLHFGFDKGTKLSDKFRKEYISKYPSTTTSETTNPEYLIKGNQKGAIDYNDRKTTSNDIWKGDNYKNVWIPKVNSAINNPQIADRLISQIENYSGQDADDVKYQLSKAKTKEEKLKIINDLATDELLGPFHKLVNDSIDIASSPNNNEFAKDIELPETAITKKKTSGIPKEAPKKDSKLLNVLSSVMPYIRPSDAEALDYNQLLGEMYALGNNQLEPVQAQSYQPQLRTPYDISLQDILNENQADYRSQQRMIGNNPAAQAMLNAQKYAANQKVLGEQFRLNQANKDQVYSQNINTLNDAKLKNLAIYDQQYDRQASAKANTKATTQAALNSISSKYLQNDAANRKLQIYENLYGYRFGDDGRITNYNGPAVFNSPQITDGQDIPVYDNNGNIVEYRRPGKQQTVDSVRTLPINPEKTTDTKSKLRNGKNLNSSIVKAMKNL